MPLNLLWLLTSVYFYVKIVNRRFLKSSPWN
ncbi:hypothetical protein T4B_2273 [Trichinella pseudospiralis]|uniref:Uncharacterized protein n=1 Tax=Trichinella pseudospiralis TaxID=6337 RepID=A0A0V1FG50_TRIPS|nr:hypothetical protein T4A_1548 [Trichinella pseudospiralis]KRY85016.1 hypothetical protein T4B_2786 [Trichinella pseudospiralis]KRY95881.1 hypothetical protein T4B_2273 [Trichinella pseudospiralis]